MDRAAPRFPVPAAVVDARGALCPIPVTRTARRLARLRSGDVVEIVADDRMILVDLPSWCFSWRHEYLGHEERGRALHLYVRKRSLVGEDTPADGEAEREGPEGDGASRRGVGIRPRAPGESVRPRAVGLVSGGLDSTLAAEMLKRQGVEVVGLHFSTGFCKVDHRRAVGRAKDRGRNLDSDALRAGAAGGFPVEIVDVADEYLQQVVLRPRHGYGAQANPCIDCRIFMLRKAREHADRIGAEMVFTGEVIGQRPFSQYREALRLVERESGLEGRLLRPLSAQHLDPTRAEETGRIDRARLGRIGGRSRRPQEALAREFAIDGYPQPSGGCCYLADEAYARRFRDLLAHGGAAVVTQDDVLLLKVGRQFRLSRFAKLHVGREEAENAFLKRLRGGWWVLEAEGVQGPTGILVARSGAEPPDEDLRSAAGIIARYADLAGASEAIVTATRAGTAEGPPAAGDAWEGGVMASDGAAGARPAAGEHSPGCPPDLPVSQHEPGFANGGPALRERPGQAQDRHPGAGARVKQLAEGQEIRTTEERDRGVWAERRSIRTRPLSPAEIEPYRI
jgi:tRNA-specific 2-thiouridylase